MEKIDIIYKTPDFLAINKPAGLLVHHVKSIINDQQLTTTLVDWILKNYPEIKNVGDNPKIRPGIAHRLDKDTSGIILICRNQKFFDYAKKLFQNHLIKKTYFALVWGKLKLRSGIIEKSISIKNDSIKRTIYKGRNKKEAITEFKVLNYYQYPHKSALLTDKYQHQSATFSLLKVNPKTGRTHQIRVHLASIGHPIVGDALYGQKENPFGLKRQFLHAESLEFNLIDGSRIKLEADLPKDLQNVLKQLKSSD